MLVFFLHSALAFFCMNNMVATHVFRKLVFSARPFMKKASWGWCVLVFDSSGEPAAQPGISDFCAPGGSVIEFEVGRTTSCEEGDDAKVNAPMDHESGMGWFYFCIRRDLIRFSFLLFFRSSRSPSS